MPLPPPSPPYRVIYNWDGAPHGYTPVPQSIEDFLDGVYAPLRDTQVDALFWCVGEHTARWQSQRLEQLGDLHDRRYESAAAYTHTENIRLMLERGVDPQAEIIRRGHELGIAVYGSLRMNDNHFDGAQLADLPRLHHTELTELRRQHPEWLLGNRTAEWFALSWDLSVPEVRRHRLDHVRELCENYEWDGIELDWQRHAFHLPRDLSYRLRWTLTDLQRAAREITRKRAEQLGRPFHLAARVSGSLRGCDDIGYDVETWVREGLVDVLIPAGNAATDPAIEVAEFVALCEPHGVAVYPGFDGGLPGGSTAPEGPIRKDRLRTRAIGARHRHLGATGIYVFNWHSGAIGPRVDMLHEIGEDETLAPTDKVYAATHRVVVEEGPWRGAYRGDRLRGQVPVPLCKSLTDTGPVIFIELADETTAAPPLAVELRIRIDEWIEGDGVAVRWNGEELSGGEPHYDLPASNADLNAVPLPISQVSSAAWLRFALSPDSVQAGCHTVEVVLRRRHPQLACDLQLTDVEVAVAHTSEYAESLL
ncbi:MAG: hypothetical protein VX733_10630 [Candidatus Latescibacterota bacterium]|nr:hypothetical protein [Candidatus Latescibacterota bacterium]